MHRLLFARSILAFHSSPGFGGMAIPRLFSILAALIVGATAWLPPALPSAGAADSIVLPARRFVPTTPVGSGGSLSLSSTFDVTLSSAASAPLQPLGYEDGAVPGIPLGSPSTVPSGTHTGSGGITVTSGYTAKPGLRWLSLKAVLGPPDQPLASLDLRPYVVMDELASGFNVKVYAPPGIAPALATSYAEGYEAAWKQIGRCLTRSTTKHTSSTSPVTVMFMNRG